MGDALVIDEHCSVLLLDFHSGTGGDDNVGRRDGMRGRLMRGRIRQNEERAGF